MTVQIEDIISAICIRFEAAHTNDFQTVYTVTDAKEAKLAFDVLVTFGFDAKVYHDDNKPSKLYVTLAENDALAMNKISDALAYANSLSQIKQILDSLCADEVLAAQLPDYIITFSNAQSSGKQINIQINQAEKRSTPFASAKVSAPQPLQRPAQPVQARPKRMAQKVAGPEEETISSGPALTQRTYPGQIKPPEAESDTLTHQVSLYLRGNIATSSFAALSLIIFLALLFGLFVSAKTFLCPDFALEEGKRNHSWYCKQEGDDEKKPVHFETK